MRSGNFNDKKKTCPRTGPELTKSFSLFCFVINRFDPKTTKFQLLTKAPLDFAMTKINDRVAESAEQDQTARMYSLILLYNPRKIWSLSTE